MVKLATARESRMYGRWPWEYTNAGVYVFSTIVLLCGLVAQFSKEAKSGLVVILVGLGLIIIVNIHDLMAHLTGINYRFRLMELDTQLLFVEVAVPVLQALGGLLLFIAIFLLLLQVDRGFGYDRIESHALKLLIAGSSLWVVGSIHNSCQIYEQAEGILQILQHAVQIPFFIASLLFLAGALVNYLDQLGRPPPPRHGLNLLSYRWVWIGIVASLFLIIGGLTNVVKVVKMGEIKLEKLRGGAQEQLIQQEDGEPPFLIQERRRRRRKRPPA